MWLCFLAFQHQKGWWKEFTIGIVEADGETCPKIAGQVPGAAVGSCKGAPAHTCVGSPSPSFIIPWLWLFSLAKLSEHMLNLKHDFSHGSAVGFELVSIRSHGWAWAGSSAGVSILPAVLQSTPFPLRTRGGCNEQQLRPRSNACLKPLLVVFIG